MKKNSGRTGVWLVGAYGDIATTLIVGKFAIQNKLSSETGLVSSIEPMNQLGFVELNELVVGGHDIVENTLTNQAEVICERSKTYSYRLFQKIKPQLEEVDKNIVNVPELAWNVFKPTEGVLSLDELCEKFRQLLRDFVNNNELDHVVVVNLASAEPQVSLSDLHADLDSFINLLASDRKDLVTPSMLCAYSAFMEGFSFVNFTPNVGASVDALKQLADKQSASYCGNDGKTGETLIKTALAPMFAARHLKIMSWEGTNMLGNGDGKTLKDPENCKNKIQNKEAVLPGILGYPLHSNVDIKYVPSLGDWKTAWDLIHFQGFLDVPMTMQFTWQGCDSILAAPLVLDMIRFAEFAHRNGESGAMTHLSCFFKNPLDTVEHDFFKQFEMLLNYTDKHLADNSTYPGIK